MYRITRQRWWPRGGGDDLYRVEHVLATGRVFLGLALLVSVALNPRARAGGGDVGVLATILLFLVYSALLLAFLRIRRHLSPMLGLGMHALDLTWVWLGTSITEGRPGAFSIFNVFALVAAAYRWGLRETLATAAAVALLVTSQTALAGLDVTGAVSVDAALTGGTAVWLVNLGMLAWLLGYLGEQEKLLRYEASSAAGLMASVQAEQGLGRSLRTALAELLRIFSAREILFVAAETATGRTFRSSAARSAATGRVQRTTMELPGDLRSRYLFHQPESWAAVVGSARSGGTFLETRALDPEGHRSPDRVDVPEAFRAAHPFRTLLAATFRFEDEWSGSVFLLDVPPGATGLRAVGSLRTLLREVGPALYGVYLLRRLRHEAGATERARVARELHDGVIQSLLGIEMRLDVLKRQARSTPTRVVPEVGELQRLVHKEILDLRDMLQQLRPPDPGPNLGAYLADVVDRFQRDTGIAANFVADTRELPLGSSIRRQIGRIVQEALVNVRKHSGASNVIVRLHVDATACRLTIDDDGRGYDFKGRLSLQELDARRRGPVVIKERVRDIRGTIAIESDPGRGSRLDIVVPRRL